MADSIRVENVSKSYGKSLVLDGISLSIGEGRIYGLIGPSGAGKTTLVKAIVGIEPPDSGTVHVLGRRVPNLELLREIGYMAQSDALYSELTGLENLRFFAALYRLDKAETKRRIAYVADLVKMADELNKGVKNYSGGMKRRLSLAIALVHDPSVLVLDEPTVGIDPELRQGIWHELHQLKREHGKTIILTTHVMDEAEKCDIVALIRGGALLTSGSPDELKAEFGAKDLEGAFLEAGRRTE